MVINVNELDKSHNEILNHKDIQQALQFYLTENGLALTGHEKFSWGIDFVSVRVHGVLVLTIGLPPVTDYEIDETEHTRKYLRVAKPVAV